MAKAAQADALALTALARLLGDPAPRVLHGGKEKAGVFAAASAADKAAAKLCLDNGWLVKAGALPAKGKAKKELWRISPAGIEAVLAQSDPSDLLESLRAGVERIETRSGDMIREVRENLAAALETVRTTVLAALEPLAPLKELGQIKQNLSEVLNRVKPVNVADVLNKLAAAAPPSPAAQGDDSWLAAVLRMATEQRQANPFQRLTLPQVFERLKAQRPELSLGQFHDGLRRLHQENRIRLGPYTQALATLDDPRNALYLDREVKYYVEVP
jgi:hypothetical protein